MSNKEEQSTADKEEIAKEALDKLLTESCEEFGTLGGTTLKPFVPLLSLKGTALNFSLHFPMLPFFKMKRPRRTVFMCGRQEGKCLSLDNTVIRANGYPECIRDINVDDSVITKNDNYRAEYNKVNDILDNGIKPILKISTRRGAQIEVTPNHRVFTITGYKYASELKEGDFLCSYKKAGKFLDKFYPKSRIKSTAYLIGDGCIRDNDNKTKGTTAFFSGDNICIKDFSSCVEDGLCSIKDTKSNAEYVTVFRKSILHSWLREDGLMNKKSLDKFIPRWVFDLSEEDTCLFISCLWATDGSVKKYKNTVLITYCSISRDLVYQLKALLSKLGIISHIRRKKAGYGDVVCNDAYELKLETRESFDIFADKINPINKPRVKHSTTVENNNRDVIPIDVNYLIKDLFKDVYDKNGNSLRSRGLRHTLKYNISNIKLQKYIDLADELGLQGKDSYTQLVNILSGDFIWEKITKIEDIGEKPTIDLSIDDNHNFMLEGIVVHNSVSLAASSILRCRLIGYYDILSIQPRFDQIKRFSTEYTGPMLDESLISGWLKDSTRQSSFMKRAIAGGSTIHYAYAFLTPDATRGYAVQELHLDEIQDITNSFVPIIEEVLSAQTEFGIRVYAGTPKGIDNTLNVQFQKSSAAHVHIKCHHCNKENIANKENHIYKMIGKKTCICAFCGRDLDLTKMRFIHHNRAKRNSFEGYHIPQIVHPLHAWFPEKWAELLDKLNDPTYAETTFENEILGIASENVDAPITEGELREACLDKFTNNIENAVSRLRNASMVVMGVDWSGFGSAQESTTVVSIVASYSGTDSLHTLYIERLPAADGDANSEALRILQLYKLFRCQFFAHDYSGAGVIREALIVQLGMRSDQIIPFSIVHAPVRRKVISFYAPADGARSCYNIDKTRSLMVLFQMVKQGKVLFPSWDSTSPLLRDFLNITQETKENPRGADFVIMDKKDGYTDDTTHSINFAVSTIWHASGRYPEMAPQTTKEEIEQMNGSPTDIAAALERARASQQSR